MEVVITEQRKPCSLGSWAASVPHPIQPSKPYSHWVKARMLLMIINNDRKQAEDCRQVSVLSHPGCMGGGGKEVILILFPLPPCCFSMGSARGCCWGSAGTSWLNEGRDGRGGGGGGRAWEQPSLPSGFH